MSLQQTQCLMQNYKHMLAIFKMSIRPRFWGVSVELRGTMAQKLEDGIPPKGQTFAPEILRFLLDSKFDVNFGFAINHDLII